MHQELITYGATQPNTGAAATAYAGDTLTIKNSQGPARILAMWAYHNVSGFQQIVYPSGHDTTRNWRTVVMNNDARPRNAMGCPWWVQPQELLTITIAGSNIAGQIETGCLAIHYDNLPGVTSRNIGWDSLLQRTEKQVTVQCTLTGVAGAYSVGEPINAESDLLRANRDYALIGMESTVEVAALAISGPDTGNTKIGMPAVPTEPDMCGNWFAMLSRAYNLNLIPVINSGNRASTLVYCANGQGALSPVVSLNLALLRNQRADD